MSDDRVLRLARFAMATRFEVVVATDGDAVGARAAAEAALDAIADTEASLSRFEPASFVSRLARTGADAALRTDPLDRAWLLLVDDLRRRTAGAFDPCHLGDGHLVLLDAAAERVGLSAADTPVDLGAIGKGVALDRARDELVDAGVEVALLHGGTSTALALGAPPGRSGWGVRVEWPGRGSSVIELCDAALSVSAQHGQDRLPEGGHVVDARAGTRSGATPMVACTAPRATLADAWSTALLAHGPTPDLLGAAAAAGVRLLEPPDRPTASPTAPPPAGGPDPSP